jgi:hypothetical protein
MFVLGVIPLSLGTVILGRGNEYLCNSSSSFETPGNVCLLQGFAYIFAGLWTVSWWFLQAHSVFYMIVINSLRTHRVKPNRFTITPAIYKQLAFAGGLPAVCIAAALSTGSIGFAGGPVPFCNMASGEPWLEWVFFYGPISVMVVVACTLMGAVIWTITTRLSDDTNTRSPATPRGGDIPASASKRAFLRFLTYNKRPLIFVISKFRFFLVKLRRCMILPLMLFPWLFVP